MSRRVNHGLGGIAGYTLMEVLAALAMLAIALPVVLQGVSLAGQLGGFARQQAEAATLAKDKLEELAATGNWRTGQLSGDCGPDWPEYHWSAAVMDWNGGAVRELEVQVTWTARLRQRSVTMSTLINTEEY